MIDTTCRASCCDTWPLETCGSASIGATAATTTAQSTVETAIASRSARSSIDIELGIVTLVGETWHSVATACRAHGTLDGFLERRHGERLDRHRRAAERHRGHCGP